MKKSALTVLASTALLLAHTSPGFADTYHPYHLYEEYYKQPAQEPPPEPQAPPRPDTRDAKQPQQPEQPITLTQPPEFLFPEELGFGVAVGSPYDLFYLANTYYLLKTGTWYRSASYRGPWAVLGLSRVPPVLRKHNVAKIRELRNREFAAYWKDKEKYKGRQFRPEEDHRLPMKK